MPKKLTPEEIEELRKKANRKLSKYVHKIPKILKRKIRIATKKGNNN